MVLLADFLNYYFLSVLLLFIIITVQ